MTSSNWQFQKRYARCSAGLYYIEARYRRGRFFNITVGMHITRANSMLSDKDALIELAEKVHLDRYGYTPQ